MGARRDLLEATQPHYRRASRRERGRMLDEFVRLTGYHRKHAVRLLNAEPAENSSAQPPRTRCYGEAVKQALIVLWEASDRVCGKRLHPIIPVLVPALERHGQLCLESADRERVLSVSAATIDRLLSEVRTSARGGLRRRAGFSSAVRRSVPVRTFADWNDPLPGFLEVDLVAHGGTSMHGAFIHTLVATDIATGWTECVPLLVRDGTLVVEVLGCVGKRLPFPMRGVDFDNDSVFMNELVVGWCREGGLIVTRARAYRKNDQAWVEQKKVWPQPRP